MATAEGKPLSFDEISKRVHKSKPWVVRNYGAYRNATETLRKSWAANKIPAETVMEIAALPEEEQEEAVEEQISMRAGGSKKAAGKARNKAKKEKKAYDVADRPSIADVRAELEVFAKAFEVEDLEDLPIKKIEDPYAQGVVDALRWVNGNLDYADIGASYDKLRTRCAKDVERMEEERLLAEEEAREAEAEAERAAKEAEKEAEKAKEKKAKPAKAKK
jgi:hypothetical protein